MKKRVLCTVPVDKTGNLHFGVASWMSRFMRDKRYIVDVCFPRAIPSENSRAHGMREFLGGDYAYWLSMDSDNPPVQQLNGHDRDPLDLVDLDLDFIGLPTPVYQYDSAGHPRLTWNVYSRHPSGKGYGWRPFRHEELEECDAVGTGCFVVARRVIEALRDAQPFQRLWHPDGTERLGSDLAFCERVKRAGFKVWAHWGYLCNHYTQTDGIGLMQINTEAKKCTS